MSHIVPASLQQESSSMPLSPTDPFSFGIVIAFTLPCFILHVEVNLRSRQWDAVDIVDTCGHPFLCTSGCHPGSKGSCQSPWTLLGAGSTATVSAWKLLDGSSWVSAWRRFWNWKETHYGNCLLWQTTQRKHEKTTSAVNRLLREPQAFCQCLCTLKQRFNIRIVI